MFVETARKMPSSLNREPQILGERLLFRPRLGDGVEQRNQALANPAKSGS